MASFINAQRWATGVKTHKTVRGDFVVCTGTECLGCFPEDNPGEAEELGVCDINSKDYPFRTFLNDDYFEARLEKAWKGKQTNFIHEICVKTNTRNVYLQDKESVSSLDRGEEVPFEKQKVCLERNGNVENIQEKPGTSASQRLNEENQVTTSTFSQKPDINNKSVDTKKDNGNSDIYETLEALGIKTVDRKIMDKESEHTKKKERGNGFLSISKSNSSQRSIPVLHRIIGDDLYEEMTGARAKAFLKKMGEDCRCIFFAIEYYGHCRKVPPLTMTEIVEQLSKMIDIQDIKCVQRFYNIWHIVVRSPGTARVLVTKGVVIRGRHYTLVQDSDSYLDIVH